MVIMLVVLLDCEKKKNRIMVQVCCLGDIYNYNSVKTVFESAIEIIQPVIILQIYINILVTQQILLL
jgi:hypothetical protein